MSIRTLSVLAMVVVLSACGGGTPGPNQIVVKTGENGSFSGTAGFGWTPEEIRKSVCTGSDGRATAPKEFGIQKTDTHYIVQGRC